MDRCNGNSQSRHRKRSEDLKSKRNPPTLEVLVQYSFLMLEAHVTHRLLMLEASVSQKLLMLKEQLKVER